jgi:two-component system invasion response regulator UvrY
MIRILIADDHPIVRRGIKQVLSETGDMAVEDEAGSCDEVLQKLEEKRFDVVLLDIAMPGGGGMAVLERMRRSGMDVPVLILSIFPEELYAMRALKAGASGYLAKSCESELLVGTIRKIASGA